MPRRLRLKPIRRQVMLVTGASSGIGLAIATEAARRGAAVVLVSRNEEALRRITREINVRGGRAVYAVADVARRDQVEHAAEIALKAFGGIDTWVNDAGVGVYARLEDLPEADHRRIFETNYWGVVNGALTALQIMKRQGGGAIITIGSIASDIPSPILSAYAASKHAVKGFVDSLRLELIHDAVPVSLTLVKPSGIGTPFGQHARNLLDDRAVVPPPAYDPHIVADAVLHAAETPTREITVGGAGKAMTLFHAHFPKIADQLFATAFFVAATDKTKPKRRSPKNLYAPARDGQIYGDQKIDRRASVYNAIRTNPTLTWSLAAAAAAGIGLALASGSKRNGEARIRAPLAAE